ncbi:cysteine synthase A [bacterium]|nr:cysteine synthase A [bacterium]
MTKLFDDNSCTIGHTPLVRLNRIGSGNPAAIYAKIEGRNPAYSVKCRIGANMIWDAEARGLLKPGKTIIEPTSGNTGIALASVCAARGYRLTLTMPDTMSMERRKLLQALGARLILTDGAQGMKGAVDEATAIQAQNPESMLLLQQFTNPANPAIHEKTTGPEIWKDTGGRVDVLVAGVGTGGTISGTSRFLKSQRTIVSVAVEPADSPVITQHMHGESVRPGSHKIQGIGAGFIPGNLDISLIDRVETAGNEEAIETARRLARDEGILSGISSGAAAAVAERLSRLDEFEGKNIVVILPDSGERYLSTALYD